MGKQHAQGDLIFAVGGEFRQVANHRIVDAQLAVFDEFHDRRSGGKTLVSEARSKIVSGVMGSWAGRMARSPKALR